jgi:hypothetical protein
MNEENNNFGGLNIGDIITVIPVDPFNRDHRLLGNYAVKSLLEVTTIGDMEIILTTGLSFIVSKRSCVFSNAQYNFVIWDEDVRPLINIAVNEAKKQFDVKVLQLNSIKGMF